jgi:hypothetical protein
MHCGQSNGPCKNGMAIMQPSSVFQCSLLCVAAAHDGKGAVEIPSGIRHRWPKLTTARSFSNVAF